METTIFKFDTPRHDWNAFIKAMQSGKTIQIDEEMFFYWLEVLPPAYMHKTKKIDVFNDGNVHDVFCDFGFAEGYDYITDFWKKEGKFFCKRSNELKTWD